MAHPDISLLGAVYSDVSGVTLPKSGGGMATFPFVEGSQTITTNNTYDVTNLAQVIVNVAGGGGSGLVYESGSYAPASDTAAVYINFTGTHSTLPFFVLMWDTNHTHPGAAGYNQFYSLINLYAFGDWIATNTNTSKLYLRCVWAYTTSSSNSVSGLSITGINGSSNGNISYWLTTSKFYANTNSSSRYWKSGRTYKWIAVWPPTT